MNNLQATALKTTMTHKEREVMIFCRWVKLSEASKAALIGKLTEEEIIRLRMEVSKTFIDALNSINS